MGMELPESQSQETSESVVSQYRRLMDNVILKNVEYRMRIIGPNVIDRTTLLYWEASTAQELGFTLAEWRTKLTVSERGFEIAVRQIRSMLQVIERHHEMQYDVWKKKNDKSNKSQ